MDRILDYVVKNSDRIIEGILEVSVFVLAKLYGWSIFKKVSRALCGWPKPRERSPERSLCGCACCGRSTSTPSFDVEEQREEVDESQQHNHEADSTTKSLHVRDLLQSHPDAVATFARWKKCCYTITSNHEFNM